MRRYDIETETYLAYGPGGLAGHPIKTEETLARHLARRLAGRPASLPVRMPDGTLVPARDFRGFTSWFSTIHDSDRAPRSCKAPDLSLAFRCWRAGNRARAAFAALPWTWSEFSVQSVRGVLALHRIVRRLGRRGARTSRSGRTTYAPTMLSSIRGRDFVRISRLSPAFLRWLAAIDWAPSINDRCRIDWAAMAPLIAEWREVSARRAELQALRIPMGSWRRATLLALDLGSTADEEGERERWSTLHVLAGSASSPLGILLWSGRSRPAPLLVVRCPSTGHRHILRAIVRWEDWALSGEAAVEAALARSFGLGPGQYRPEVES